MCASERALLSDAVLTGLCMSGDVVCPCTYDQGSICSPNVHKLAHVSVHQLI